MSIKAPIILTAAKNGKYVAVPLDIDVVRETYTLALRFEYVNCQQIKQQCHEIASLAPRNAKMAFTGL